MTSNIY